MKRSIKIFVFFLIAGALVFGAYFFNKPGRDVAAEKTIPIAASELFKAFIEDETKANSLYLDKAIAVNGTVGEITKNQQGQTIIILQTDDPMFGVACTIKSSPAPLINAGSQILLKGICSGYTSDVVLRDCIIPD